MTVLNIRKYQCTNLHSFYTNFMTEKEMEMVKEEYGIDSPSDIIDQGFLEQEIMKFVLDNRDGDYIINYNGDHYEIYRTTDINEEDVINYFNKYIVHREEIIHSYQCKIDQGDVEFSDRPTDIDPIGEGFYFDINLQQYIGCTKEDAFNHIKEHLF